MDDLENCIQSVSIPDTGGQTLTGFMARRQRLKLVEWVEKINLDFMRGKGQDLFAGLPDEKDCAKAFDISNLEAISYLNFEVHSGYLARIRVEAVQSAVNRKVEGYIVTNSKELKVLKDRIKPAIESEFGFQVEEDDFYDVVKNYFLDRITSLEGTVLGRTCRLFMAIVQLEKEGKKSSLYGTNQYHETLEKRTIKQMSHFLTETLSDAEKRQSQNTKHNRRAEDSQDWKEFEKKHEKTGAIPWDHSFQVMGAFFTVRILLRKELYSEILLWADTVRIDNPDLERILKDCEKTATSIKNKTGRVPPELDRAIKRIAQKIYDRS